MQSFSIEEEANIVGGQLALSHTYTLLLAIGIHQFLQLSAVLDLEENFLAVLTLTQTYLALHFEVEVFGAGLNSVFSHELLFYILKEKSFILHNKNQINELTSSAWFSIFGRKYLPC